MQARRLCVAPSVLRCDHDALASERLVLRRRLGAQGAQGPDATKAAAESFRAHGDPAPPFAALGHTARKVGAH